MQSVLTGYKALYVWSDNESKAGEGTIYMHMYPRHFVELGYVCHAPKHFSCMRPFCDSLRLKYTPTNQDPTPLLRDENMEVLQYIFSPINGTANFTREGYFVGEISR